MTEDMTSEVLINATPQETRVAVLEDGMLREILIERPRNRGVAGNIYLGHVVRVLPGMQAAFVDIGLERTAFLHARDLATDPEARNNYQQADPHTSITSLLHEGQKITVQAVKNPIGDKGARLTGRLSIPSRTLVYLPNSTYTGISRRVETPAVRESLWSAFTNLRESVGVDGGFIIRTAAADVDTGADTDAGEMRADMEFLMRTWRQILKRQSEQLTTAAPALLHRNLPLALRTLRDLPWREVKKVRIDCGETCRQVTEFVAELIPAAVDRIEHYTGTQPIFDLHGVEDDIGKALQKRVPLKSGGHLIFDQTEALTTVDINTGSFVGKHNLEETIFQTNLEAAAVLARQLRVRNIGGIVIVDFIDMSIEEHRAEVMGALERELARDPTNTQVNQMSSLGLVEITRKRTSESLERLLAEPCPACHGRGVQKTAQSTCYEIFREILRGARHGAAEKYRVVASRAVIDLLLENESDSLAGVQKSIGKTIQLQAEPGYRQEQFDVVSD